MTKIVIFRKIPNLLKIIKFDSGVEYAFPGRFWKAEGIYFAKIKFAAGTGAYPQEGEPLDS